ncbi:T9SS type A sorting domain-containing protein [Flammeovirga sp. SJP92]|uniref:T9SS type A sorting domain-containing protein n=1 Tax=Flammeovirga sp. SJP92 TaxID=1775430 RepID=UPI0007892B24|nr:T9SS type A sorting domain-containing protein [Flammeovirga sp. SJP92]KXX70058.1 hypothetical protein AVL50_14385 [Flammeovirga sp. SJP92]
MMNKFLLIKSLFLLISLFNYSWAQNIPATINSDIIIGGALWPDISSSLGNVQVTASNGGANTTVIFNHLDGRSGNVNNNILSHYSVIEGDLTIDESQTVIIEESSVLVINGNLFIDGTLQYNNSNGNSKHVFLIVLGNISGDGTITGGNGSHDQPPYASGSIDIDGDHKGGEGNNIDDLPSYISDKLKDDGYDLPVELISFSASILDNAIEINWATATEINASHFEVYSSTDRRNWNLLGKVEASGNSNVLIEYTFIDENEYQNEVYYKLIQYDFDGINESFGPLVVYPSNNQNVLRTSVFPNPADNGNVSLQISGLNIGSQTTIQILNKEGKLIFGDVINGSNDIAFNYRLDLSSLFTTGMYIIKVNSGKQQSIEKLIIK